MQDKFDRLPKMCFSMLPSKRDETIILLRGEEGYYPCHCRVNADELNKIIGVPPAQVMAMEMGSLYGFHVRGADPSFTEQRIIAIPHVASCYKPNCNPKPKCLGDGSDRCSKCCIYENIEVTGEQK